jgi:uncharacterized membrane protein YhaH (DUF805 family)
MLLALFSWSGRMGRLAYFGYSLLLGAVLVVLGLVLLLPLRNAADSRGVMIAIVAVLVVMGILGGFCLAAKRLHDLDMSALHYVWIIFVPALLNGFGAAMQQLQMTLPALFCSLFGGLISVVMGLFLLFWPGTEGPNRYGEPE